MEYKNPKCFVVVAITTGDSAADKALASSLVLSHVENVGLRLPPRVILTAESAETAGARALLESTGIAASPTSFKLTSTRCTSDNHLHLVVRCTERLAHGALERMNPVVVEQAADALESSPIPVAVALVPVRDDGQAATRGLLAVTRAIPPVIGGVAFPGGYIDEGESAEVAVERELGEETGATVSGTTWTPLYTRCTPQNRLLIFMRSEVAVPSSVIKQFKPNEEVSELSVVTRSQSLVFPLHTEALQGYNW